ncbi:hypothetical protein OPQ81_011673 [Rhizoctonia solani]|nr:hypothetical protein OPQ81_011673 [Rhizoctonia solani]
MVDLASSSGNVTTDYKPEDHDIQSSGSSDSTVKRRDTDNAVASREVPSERPKPQPPKTPIHILIVGPSRSGKTYTINDSCRGTADPMASGPYEATKRIKTTRVLVDGQLVELIDTPGFDNVGMSDVEAFVEIAEYLLNPKNIRMGITGIIYVHRVGNTVHSRSLLRNFRVLTHIFLGTTGINRLTFLVTQSTTQDIGHRNTLDEMRARGSAFSAVVSAGATIASSPNRPGFITILRSYLSQVPIILPVQLDESYKSHTTFVAQVEKELGYYERKSAQSLLNDQEQHLRELYERKLASQYEAEMEVRKKLQESQLEYSSLRSQLQLQENTEQNEVVQALRDLNRMIDDLGRSISAWLADNYVVNIFGKDLAEVTTLDALDLNALKTLVGHRQGTSSLVLSSHGRGMQIESFFDYAIRHMLCRHLFRWIFEPFHPGISPSLDEALSATHENIQKQVSQTNAGKWRSETFKNIHDPERHHLTVEQHVDAHLEKLFTAQILPLIKCVLGRDIDLTEDHYSHTRSLIQTAWEWNSRLKGGVIMLGEFFQVAYSRYSPFDPIRMVEFEPNRRNPQPTRIIGTLALGLLSKRAVGGGNPVEETVVCKAVVLTKNIFT